MFYYNDDDKRSIMDHIDEYEHQIECSSLDNDADMRSVEELMDHKDEYDDYQIDSSSNYSDDEVVSKSSDDEKESIGKPKKRGRSAEWLSGHNEKKQKQQQRKKIFPAFKQLRYLFKI